MWLPAGKGPLIQTINPVPIAIQTSYPTPELLNFWEYHFGENAVGLSIQKSVPSTLAQITSSELLILLEWDVFLSHFICVINCVSSRSECLFWSAYALRIRNCKSEAPRSFAKCSSICFDKNRQIIFSSIYLKE